MENPTTALLFSGGRSSCILLHILEPYLDEILVIWCNTGAAYESTRKQMDQVRNSVPHFLEITSDQPADIEKWGYPTDILPIRHDISLKGSLEPRLQTPLACCSKNIWLPLYLCLQDRKIGICYAGVVGDMYLGFGSIEFKMPMQKWTAQMVLDYVKKHNIMVPPYYHGSPGTAEEKSRDCWNCTGYLWHSRARIAGLPFYQKTDVIQRLEQIEKAVLDEMGQLQGITKGV